VLDEIATPSGSAVTLADRFVAYAVDGLALALVNNVIFFGFHLEIWMGILLSFVLWQVYFACFWSSLGGGQTPGKRFVGLRVLSESGAADAGLGRAATELVPQGRASAAACGRRDRERRALRG
jgi:uncharacterized RDD family membrane protein YckC